MVMLGNPIGKLNDGYFWGVSMEEVPEDTTHVTLQRIVGKEDR